MRKIRKGDEVVVIAGRDKGKRGSVRQVIQCRQTSAITHVIVDGIGFVKKHKRPNPSKNDPGGVIQREAMIHASNVALYNKDKTTASGADRVRFSADDKAKGLARCFASDGRRVS